jgi:hypothetical protein
MMTNTPKPIHKVAVIGLDLEDRVAIRRLHKIGRAFQLAIGAYEVDYQSQYEAGTQSKMITPEEDAFIRSITDQQSALDPAAMSMRDMEDHAIYYATYKYCMAMQTVERYLKPINVSFAQVADSVHVKVSNRKSVERQLAVCEKYGFGQLAQLLMMKRAP